MSELVAGDSPDSVRVKKSENGLQLLFELFLRGSLQPFLVVG